MTNVMNTLWSCLVVAGLILALMALLTLVSCTLHDTRVEACYTDDFGHNACISTQIDPVEKQK